MVPYPLSIDVQEETPDSLSYPGTARLIQTPWLPVSLDMNELLHLVPTCIETNILSLMTIAEGYSI